MLQVINETIREIPTTLTTTNTFIPSAGAGLSSCDNAWYQLVYWGSYPVYICTDKTKKRLKS